MTTPDDRAPDPTAIASATFSTARRGFEVNEVRGYLQRVAAEVRALSEREVAARQALDELRAQPSRTGELDEATVAAWLGEEAARVLTTARDAAHQVRAKAEDQASQLTEEASAEAARLRTDAEAEATTLRDAVDAEVAQRRQESIAEAETEIEVARQEGRSMVSEARAVRERMLADLSRRRDGARSQLAALRAERDRIVNAIEATRDHLDRLMDDLRAASPDDERELPSVSYEQDLRSVTSSEPRLTLVRPLHPVHQDREPGATQELEAGELESPFAEEVSVEGASPAIEIESELGAEAGVDVVDVELGEPAVADDEEEEVWVEAGESVEETEAFDEFEAGTEAGGIAPGVAPSETEGEPLDTGEKPTVDDLFAAIRAARADAVGPRAVARAGGAAGGEEGEGAPGDEDVDGDEGELDPDTLAIRARNAAVAELQATLARQLKRALADEQNEVFDRLRRVATVGPPDELLGTDAEHAERYRATGEDAVWTAALVGARSVTVGEPEPGVLEGALEQHRVLDEVLDEVTLEVALPVRDRLEAALAAAGGEADEATHLLRNAYRDWKSQRLDELAGELVRSAYGRGAFAALPSGAEVRWVVDRSGPQCPDADVNEAAGPRKGGDAFPSGHRHPPASAGCRCLLVLTHG